jgi:enoyl-CoA hydratase/carnithine racemase
MSYQTIAVAFDHPLATVSLNRPEKRNALSLLCMRELIEVFDSLGRTGEIRAVILAAAGKAFSSGHDLSEMTGRTVAEYRELFDVCTELMHKIQSIPQPVVAQVQGIATAAGCQLVATCDLAVASEEASFATPGVKIGLFCTTPWCRRFGCPMRPETWPCDAQKPAASPWRLESKLSMPRSTWTSRKLTPMPRK